MYRIVSAVIITSVITSSLIVPYGSASAADNNEILSDNLQIEPQADEQPKMESQDDNTYHTRSVAGDEKSAQQPDRVEPSLLVDTSKGTTDTQVPPILSSDGVATGPETAPHLIVTSFMVSSTIEYLEFYNQGDTPYDLGSVSVRATHDDKTCTLSMARHEWLLPQSFLLISSPTAHTGATVQFTSDCDFDGTIGRLEVFSGTSRLQLIDGIAVHSGSSWFRHRSTVKSSCIDATIPSSLKQTGSVSTDFITCASGPPARSDVTYKPPAQSNLRIIEIMSNSRSCMPDETSDDCFDYVKVKNMGSEPVNLAELRLRTGSSTSSATSSNSFHWMQPTLNPIRDEYILEPSAILTVKTRDDGSPVSITNDEGNIWIEDYFGVMSYHAVHYTGMGSSAARGKTWAFDTTDRQWKYGIPSPYKENIISESMTVDSPETSPSGLKPCRDDQYRSEETNRCRSLAPVSTSTPCKEGQYRNEETNRCRSIATAAARVLKPCADDQFRSPETHRCRTIVGSEDLALVDCGEGRERNPETHRCRNSVRSTPAPADFAIEPVREPASVFIGWWMLGGVGLLVVGYAGWEWRQEIGQSIRKITQFIKTSR
jgi:hypothetical protein